MLRVFYKSDYKIRETFTTQAGVVIDPRNFNFEFVFIAGKENTFTCSHTIGASTEWVNCVYDSVNNAVLCTLDNHNLLPGRLKRELTIEEPDSDFPDGKLDYITYKAYDIEFVETPDGDSLYDIYDEEIVVTSGVNPVELAEILHESEIKDEISDDDEFNYLDSENGFGIVKTTMLKAKAFFKAFFDTIYASITHNHNLNDLTEKSYNSLTDTPSLDFEPANANIQSHIGDGDIHVTSLQKADFHSHTNKTDLDNVSGTNTGDETEESIIDKIGTDGQIKSDYLPSYVDDVIEGYYFEGVFYSDIAHIEIITAEQGKIYVDIHTNSSYRYSGTSYINISNPLDYSTDIETDKASTTKVSAIKTFYDWAVGKFVDLAKIVTTWTATTLNTNIPSEKLVKDSLDLKADITPANGSTSALRALYIARGYDAVTNTYHCVYNTNTGFYEMNGLTDITEAEMTKIYNISMPLLSTRPEGSCQSNQGVRTVYPLKYIINRAIYCDFMFQNNTNIIIIKSASSVSLPIILECRWMFYNNSALTTVDRLNVVSVVNFANTFYKCSSLTTCYLFNVKADLSFADSPLLSLASLQYLVTNRANDTTRITITVHPTVWGYLTDAENHPTWNALLVDAYNNQYIDFASA